MEIEYTRNQSKSGCIGCSALDHKLSDAQAEIARLREIADIARGLTLDRDETRQRYIGVSGDHKDAALLAAAFAAFDGGDQLYEITDRDNDRCETCRHWTRIGDSLPNLGRCGMAEPHVDPMMMFDHYCIDHEPNPTDMKETRHEG